MTQKTEESTGTKPKVFFIRVPESEYQLIVDLAKQEDRSTNKMANILLKTALESRTR